MAQVAFRGLIQWGAAASAVLAFPVLAAAQSAKPAPTFTKDVARIFQEKCESCHRPDSIAPMSLVTYEESRPWARSIKNRVAARQMPPWHLDKTIGIQDYQNDRSLSDDQIDTIVRWVDAGAPKGNAADMPPPMKWADDNAWNFKDIFGGPPDLVIKSPQYTQKALGSGRLVQARRSKPVSPKRGGSAPSKSGRARRRAGRSLITRWPAYNRRENGEPAVRQTSAPGPGDDPGPGLFMEWAVGKQGEIMRPNSGKLMLPGSKIVWDIHYSAAGEDVTDNVELGIYLYPKGQEPKYRQTLALFSGITGGNRSLDIAPNSIYVGTNFAVMRKAGRVENFQPHMHLRGKAMSVEAILPTGQTQMLGMVSNFSFNWHNNYVFTDDSAPLLPKGTILKITSWHDNTAANPNNPDPNQWVGWGDRTVDEMAHAWINITYMEDEDFKVEVEKRKQRTTTTAERQQ